MLRTRTYVTAFVGSDAIMDNGTTREHEYAKITDDLNEVTLFFDSLERVRALQAQLNSVEARLVMRSQEAEPVTR